MFWQKKWGNFRKIGSKSLEKYGLEKPRGYIGGAVESVLGCPIEEEDIPKLIGFLKRQEANGRYFSKAMQKEQIQEAEEM